MASKKIYINKKSFQRDPAVIYGQSLLSTVAEIRSDILETIDSIDIMERYLCAAKLRMEEDLPNYSDANFTMREHIISDYSASTEVELIWHL